MADSGHDQNRLNKLLAHRQCYLNFMREIEEREQQEKEEQRQHEIRLLEAMWRLPHGSV